MSNYFGFIDETGVLTSNAGQRFFALGLLKIQDTATFYEQLALIKEQAVNRFGKSFEFKFNQIKRTNYRYYYDLIDLYFQYPLLFCCLIFDKNNPDFDVGKYFSNTWDAYLGYSCLLVKKNMGFLDKLCVIADYFGKPKSSSKYFENEMRRIRGVYNACMIESHASLYIQITDILIGCIAYDFKIARQRTCNNNYKILVCNFLKKKINRTSLVGSFTVNKPNYFSVWEFKPK